ncbi:MAG: hypothetical protein QG604_838 [Candidatus Dependentiae bacterium]|nr:hypothetical protein [Candidatus Dependentiae bacterium]
MKRFGMHILLLGLAVSPAAYGSDSDVESVASSTSASDAKPKMREETRPSRDPRCIPNPFLDRELRKRTQDRRRHRRKMSRAPEEITTVAEAVDAANQKIASILSSIRTHSSTRGINHDEAFLELLTPYMEPLIEQAQREADTLGIANDMQLRLTHVVECLFNSEQFRKNYPLLALFIPASCLLLDEGLHYSPELKAKIQAHVGTHRLEEPLESLEALFPGTTVGLKND